MRESQYYYWNKVVLELENDLRFAKSPSLGNRSPANLIFNFEPRTRFDKYFRQVIMDHLDIGSIPNSSNLFSKPDTWNTGKKST